MTRVTALLILAAPSIAWADSTAWLDKGPKSVTLEGVQELVLYRGPDTGHLPTVLGTVTPTDPGDDADLVEPTLVGFALGQPTTISSDLAKARGLKVKGGKIAGAKVEVTTIEELVLGDTIVMRDVPAVVAGDGLVLGLDTLPVATAILPSLGTVKMTAMGEGAALLPGAEQLTASDAPAKPWFEYGVKTYANPLGKRFQGTVNGTDGLVYVALERMQSAFSEAGPLPATAARYEGLVEAPDAPKLGTIALPSSSLSLDGSLIDPEATIAGVLGYESLYAVDLVWDPQTQILGVAAANAPKSTDPSSLVIDAARKMYDAAAPTPEDAEEKPEDEESADTGGDPAVVSRETDLAVALWDHGLAEEAVTHLEAARDAAGDDCEPYLRLGRAYIAQGRAKAAIEPLQESARLWDLWWSQPIEARLRIAGGKVDEGEYDVEQASACYEAWGLLAAAHTSLDTYAQVDEIYRKHTDLDWKLPEVAGIALLEQGKTAEANGPLRQAVEMGGRTDPGVRVALGFAHTTFDDPEQVERLMHAMEHVASDRPVWSRIAVLELARRQGGDPVAVAKGMASGNTVSSGAALTLAVALTKAGGDATEAIATAQALVEVNGARYANAPWVEAQRAVVLALQGDASKADKVLKVVVASSAPDPDYWMALALVRDLAGDDAGAKEALQELAKRHPDVPVPGLWKQ